MASYISLSVATGSLSKAIRIDFYNLEMLKLTLKTILVLAHVISWQMGLCVDGHVTNQHLTVSKGSDVSY